MSEQPRRADHVTAEDEHTWTESIEIKQYPTDLSDTQWTRLRSYLPIPKAQGRPRTHSFE
jgi:hypothetical protein